MIPAGPSMSKLRHRRRGQSGLTLVELLVSMAVLVIIAGAIPAAISVGLRTLGPSTLAHAEAAHDISAFEQRVSADVARAACIATNTLGPYGSCSQTITASKPCTASLCVAWPDASDSDTCHIATYMSVTHSGETAIARQESTVTGGVITTGRVAIINDGVTSAFSLSATTATPTWVTSVKVMVSSTLVTNPGTFYATPVSFNPQAQTATAAGPFAC